MTCMQVTASQHAAPAPELQTGHCMHGQLGLETAGGLAASLHSMWLVCSHSHTQLDVIHQLVACKRQPCRPGEGVQVHGSHAEQGGAAAERDLPGLHPCVDGHRCGALPDAHLQHPS